MSTSEGFVPFTGVVAVDGPSGSGKSTVSRRLAAALGARYLDTGAMYRAVTLAVLRAGVDPSDTDGVLSVLYGVDLQMGTDPAQPGVRLNGESVDRQIRTEQVTGAVSAVSSVPGVRTVMIAQQRAIAATGGIVIEGRDITTVVAPDADVRVLLTASAAARAARRGGETGTNAAEQQRAMRRRDELDSRTSSFLSAADEGVLVLDSTELGIDEVVDQLVHAVHVGAFGPVSR
ncbi:(d)CMP kinase [Fodinicola feengrottensis]|uniref:(d)CMP kinase n=1 Tax=Fodinicola feengrottensis TaxID=435914 RepID=UPI0031DEB5FE